MSAPDRPRLTLRFGTRSKLWADVVHALGEQLYVETALSLTPGTRVDLDVFAPGLSTALALEGSVVAVHARNPLAGASGGAGVSVRLAETSVARCREALEAPRNDAVRTTGRAEARAEGQLGARVIFPDLVPGATVRGLSTNGLTLKASRTYPVSSHLELMVMAAGVELKVAGVVSWVRAELGLCGLQLQGVKAETVEQMIKALTDGPTAAAVRVVTVLVADDETEIVELVSKVVRGAGHRVLTASRGDTALELIRMEHPRVAFLDILMPGLDGLEVCRALRADAALKRVAVVLMSAMSAPRLEEMSKAVGADSWLVKPMRISGVRAVLEKILR